MLFKSWSLMGGGMEAVTPSWYQGPRQVISRGRDEEASRRKGSQWILGNGLFCKEGREGKTGSII